jgi:hypothetical protein
MPSRLTLLVALALVVFAGVSQAFGPPPPAKANTVIPLLRHYSPKDLSEKAVTAEMVPLLGGYVEQTHGPGGEMSEQYYALDDRTMIHIAFFRGKLVAIIRQSASAQFLETLYSTSSH